MTEKLKDIFAAEGREDWSAAYAGYRTLWAEDPAPTAAAHWAFLCWYLVDRWEKGELEAMPKGVTKPWLFARMDAMVQALTAEAEIPGAYLALLAWMKENRPYAIQEHILSQDEARAMKEGLGEISLRGRFPAESLLGRYFG